MTDTEYQGWTNRETWLIALWLNNEQELQENAKSAGGFARRSYRGRPKLPGRGRPIARTRIMPDHLDQVNDYLEVVNWGEIVRYFADDAR
jgi:hypothetical protein